MATYWQHYQSLDNGSEYHSKTALSLAVACDLAYRDSASVQMVAADWGYQQVEFISVQKGIDIDTQCFVMADSTDVVVVFRGSASLEDWLANFQAVREPGPLESTLAHEGFQDTVYPAVIKLTEVLDKFWNNNQKIWLTGHSLGGAQCSLYAGMLSENGYPIHAIYTFASPRPGDADFADRLNEQVAGPHYRVVNYGDVVPHLPPEPFFSHSGSRIILKEAELERDSESWFGQRILAIKEFVKKTGQLFDVADNHRLAGDDESYIPRLIKLADLED